MRWTQIALIALVACVAASLCQAKSLTISGPASHSKWTKDVRSSAEATHKIIFAVKQKENAAAACDGLLTELTTIGGPKQAKFLKHEEVKALMNDERNTKIVENWLASQGIAFTTTLNGDFIVVEAPVSRIESLINARFYEYKSKVMEKTVRRTKSYSLPEEVSAAVDFVGNTVAFPSIKGHYTTYTPADAQSRGFVVPSTITKFYGVDNTEVTDPAKTTQSLFEALGQAFSPDDLSTFQGQYGLKSNAVKKTIGPNDPSQCGFDPNNCAEANLDVQYITAIAQKATTWFWSIDPNSQDPFFDWILALGNTTAPPLVHSISYGSIATEDPQQDMSRFNTEVCELGLKGLSVFVSSGDDGVANFEARSDPSQCGFNPSFPATSQYVTSVGATQGPEYGTPEIACSSATNGLITTGGGFSVFFKRPSYQDALVTKFLNNGNIPPKNLFNSNGRGYPDVAALGHNYQVVIGGQTYTLSGTSASSPVFAGFISLINDYRFSQGKGPVGFLNPYLYQLAGSSSYSTIFNDITVGENNCCAGNPGSQVCCQYGFNATAGWDPLTGLGSINFQNLRKALASLIP